MAGTRNKNNKLSRCGRVGVLAGGTSNEREISLTSGRAVYEALKGIGCEVLFLDVNERLEKDIKKSGMKTAFIALHGRFGEDGTVQRMLEEIQVKYTGSGPHASRLALDKIASRREFERAGIPVPKYRIIKKDSGGPLDLNFPLVIKPQLEGSSIGLSIADEKLGLPPALDKAYRYGPKAIAEEFIKGREITVGILDDGPLAPVEIIPGGRCYDFFAKYESRNTQYLVPAPLERRHYKRAQELGVMAHRALGCYSFSRVDMILGDDGALYVLEVNSIPGLTSRSLLPKAAQAAGISFEDLCIRILEGAEKRDKTERRLKR